MEIFFKIYKLVKLDATIKILLKQRKVSRYIIYYTRILPTSKDVFCVDIYQIKSMKLIIG